MTKLHQKRQKSATPAIHDVDLTPNSEAAIWTRLLKPERNDISEEAARSILRIGFTEEDKARMHQLAQKAQEGGLTESEQLEIDDYGRVGRLLDLMHSKARLSLNRSPSPK